MGKDLYIDVMGLRTRYRQVGASGANVVLVHGIYSSIEDWSQNIDVLAERYRVWVLDLPGCGYTDKPKGFDYSLEGQEAFLREFLSTIGLTDIHLVGHSMGGRLALGLARLVPSKIASLTLVSPAVIGHETLAMFRLATIPLLGEVLTYPNPMGLRMLMREAVFDNTMITKSLIQDRLSFARMPGAQRAFLQTLRELVNISGFRANLVRDLQTWIGEVEVPLMLIWGEQDKLTPVHHARTIQKVVPASKLEIYGNCGHLPQIEHRDKFNSELTEFLGRIESE